MEKIKNEEVIIEIAKKAMTKKPEIKEHNEPLVGDFWEIVHKGAKVLLNKKKEKDCSC